MSGVFRSADVPAQTHFDDWLGPAAVEAVDRIMSPSRLCFKRKSGRQRRRSKSRVFVAPYVHVTGWTANMVPGSGGRLSVS